MSTLRTCPLPAGSHLVPEVKVAQHIIVPASATRQRGVCAEQATSQSKLALKYREAVAVRSFYVK